MWTLPPRISSLFLSGEFDLMGGILFRGVRAVFCLPDYSTGSSYTTLLARPEDDRIHGYDLRELDGLTIGVYKNAVEKIRRLEEFFAHERVGLSPACLYLRRSGS